MLRGVSAVWSVQSLLEPEEEVHSCCVVVWRVAERNSSLQSPCLSLWCPLVKRHRSPSALFVFCCFQTCSRILLDVDTKESVVFANVQPKRQRSAAKISGI